MSFEQKMRIAVTGINGQVVQSLVERASGAGIEIVTVGRPDIDLTNPTGIAEALKATNPDAVVSAAAYTAVDLAECEPDIAHAVNGIGAGAVAHAARQLNVPLVHLSTDYVFDGHLDRPYRETDATGPCSAYGQSKLEGERAVAAAHENHAILRTAWVYSPFGRNFARTMLKLASTREEIPVVADQRGTPTSALDIADGIMAVLRNLIANPSAPELRGIFHMTAGGDTNWADFAKIIFATSAAAGGPAARVTAIPASAYPTPARRPANSRLDSTKLADAHGVRLPDWRQSVPICIARLIAQDLDR